MVSINPVAEDETIELGFEWLAPRPGTDAALLLALTQTLVEEGLADRDFLDRCTVGADRVLAYLAGEGDGAASRTPPGPGRLPASRRRRSEPSPGGWPALGR